MMTEYEKQVQAKGDSILYNTRYRGIDEQLDDMLPEGYTEKQYQFTNDVYNYITEELEYKACSVNTEGDC